MILVDFTGAINAIGTTKTFYVSDGAFTTKPTDSPANTTFWPVLTDPGAISFSIYGSFDDISGGSAKLDIGEIIATNVDGRFDGFTSYSFDARPLTIRVGDKGTKFPDDFSIILYATMSSVSIGWQQLTINVRDYSFVLDTPILTRRFLGTNTPSLPNGLEGTPDDISGQIVPRCYGVCAQISPPCINTIKQTYRVSDRTVNTIFSVQIRGVNITPSTDYATSALLQADTSIPVSAFRTCLAEGLFRLGVTPDGQVTANVGEGANSGRSAALMLKRLAVEAGVPTNNIRQSDVDALHQLQPSDIQLYINDETTYRDAMDQIAKSIGAFYAFDTSGILRMGQLGEPKGLPVDTLRDYDIILGGIERVATDLAMPCWSVTVNYGKIYTVQKTDLAGSVSLATRAILAQEYRSTENHDSSILTQFKLARSLTINTLLTDPVAAQAEALRMRQLRGQAQDVFNVPVAMERATKLIKQGLWLGSELALNLSRFDLADRSFMVIGIDIQRKAKQIMFKLWGPAIKPSKRLFAAVGRSAGFFDVRGDYQPTAGIIARAGIAIGTVSASAVNGSFGGGVIGGGGTGSPSGLLLALSGGAGGSPGGGGGVVITGTPSGLLLAVTGPTSSGVTLPAGSTIGMSSANSAATAKAPTYGVGSASGTVTVSGSSSPAVVVTAVGSSSATATVTAIAPTYAAGSASGLVTVSGHAGVFTPTQSFLTATSNNYQVWTIPSDWVDSGSKVEAIGPGGSGSAPQSASLGGCGGGAGSYARKNDLLLTSNIGKTIGYVLAAGGSQLGAKFYDLNILTSTNNINGTSTVGSTVAAATITTGQTDSQGGTTASKITENAAATTAHGVFQYTINGTKQASQAWTSYAYGEFKAIAASQICFSVVSSSSANEAGIYLNLATGTNAGNFIVGTAAVVSSNIVNLGGGWWGVHLVVSFPSSDTGTSVTWAAYSASGNNRNINGSGVDAWITGRPALATGSAQRGYNLNTGTVNPLWTVWGTAGTNATTTAVGIGQTGNFGDVSFLGGSGFKPASGATGGGGGGAGGPSGAGTSATTTAGGAANNGVVAGGAVNTAGVAGATFDGTHGSGSGAGGGSVSNGLAGGNYGGGGSGAQQTAGNTGGAGAQALIIINYLSGSTGAVGGVGAAAGHVTAAGVGTAITSSLPAFTSLNAVKFIANQLGVGAHLGSSGTPYTDLTAVKTAMTYLGFQNIRDGADKLTQFMTLAGQGIRFNIFFPTPYSISSFKSVADQLIAAHPGSIVSFEGPNEIDNWPVTYNGVTGNSAAVSQQQALYNTLKADSALTGIPIFCFTLASGTPSDYSAFGNLSSMADGQPMHYYYGGGMPSPWLTSNIYQCAQNTVPNGIKVITETGSASAPTTFWGVNEDVQAKQALNLAMDAARTNARLFFYELVDETSNGSTGLEANYGLFHGDWSHKPIANGFHNLTTILSSGADANVSPDTFHFGNSNIPLGYSTVFIKTSLRHCIVLWSEPGIWDSTNQVETTAATTNVVVTLDSTYATVDVYDPMVGTSAITHLTNVNSVTVAIKDHPIIIDVSH